MDSRSLTYCVYKYTCAPTGKHYIGQTTDINRRSLSHQKPYSNCLAFRNAIQKYGWDAFDLTVLAEGLTVEQANALEDQMIVEHNSISPGGYNLKRGGSTRKYSEESKRRMREAKLGKRLTPAHAQKIGDALRGRPRVGAALENLHQLSARRIGVPRTPEVKEKLRVANQGKTLSEDTKNKIKTTCTSEEHRQKLRDAWVKRKEGIKNESA